MTEAREMQTCKSCYGEVDARAKLCPHCRSRIRKFRWPEAVGLLGALAVVAVLFAIPSLMMKRVLERTYSDDGVAYAGQIKVTSSAMAKGTSKDGPVVCVLGRIKNDSDVSWQDVVIQAEFLDDSGKLIDLGDDLGRRSLFGLLPRSEAAFKVRVIRAFPEKKYASFRVRVLTARDARSRP